MKILVVSHSATRSGAPILLLRLLRGLKTQRDWELEFVLIRGGEVQDEFLKLGRIAGFQKAIRLMHEATISAQRLHLLHPRLAFLQRGEKSLRRLQKVACMLFKAQSRGKNYDLIYANTSACGPALSLLKKFDCPIITHVHEMPYALELMGESLDVVLRESDRFVAVSQAVKTGLIANGVAPEKVGVVYGCVEDEGVLDPETRQNLRASVRDELGLPRDAFLVGGCGTYVWHKGADWFVQLARECENMPEKPGAPQSEGGYFLWVGGASGSLEERHLRFDAERFSLENCVLWLGHRDDSARIFAALDVFVLTSREDSFPLACLEAAVAGVPVVCFEGGGGMPEFVEDDAGFVVPYGDVKAMARRIQDLRSDDESRRKLGKRAREKVLERHTVSTVAPQIAEIIDSLTK